jgi:acetyl-CoA carboxylase biotin carboxyl carrier protein
MRVLHLKKLERSKPMNIKNIRQLAQIMESSGLTAIEVFEGDSKLRLEKNISSAAINKNEPAANECVAPNAPIVPKIAEERVREISDFSERAVDFNKITEVKSPMVGVFYAAPSESAEPYVKVGSKVKKGDVLCIIEAMKVMNEIICETDGEIVDICVENAQVVEFSQILFKIF